MERLMKIASCALLCLWGCAPVDRGGREHSSSSPRERGNPAPMLKISIGPVGGWVGEKTTIPVTLTNQGDAPMVIPLQGNPPTIASVLTIQVKKRGGGEEVSYPESRCHRGMVNEVDQAPLLLVRHDVPLNWLSTSFVPWSPGEYDYTLTLKNDAKEMLQYVPVRDDTGGISTRKTMQPIPGVWTGKWTTTGSFVVEDRVTDRSEDLGGSRLKTRLEKLKVDALDVRLPLGQRLEAVDTLVEMRHVYACDVLLAIEEACSSDDGMHYAVVSALYAMACKGAGYRALPCFAKLVRNVKTPTAERVLCMAILETFARGGQIVHDNRIIHLVGEDEKMLAQEVLKAVAQGSLYNEFENNQKSK